MKTHSIKALWKTVKVIGYDIRMLLIEWWRGPTAPDHRDSNENLYKDPPKE